MAKVIVDDTNLKNIADTLREKLDTEEAMKVSEFANKINEAYNAKPLFDPNWTNWSHMFGGGARIEIYNSLDYNSTMNGTDFSYMFNKATYNAWNGISVPPKQLNTSKGTGFSYMFASPQVTSGGAVPWTFYDTINANKVDYMFYNNRMVSEIPDMNFPKASYAVNFASTCNNLIKVGTINSPSVTHWTFGFSDCQKLETIEGIDLTSATTVDSLFYNCKALTNLTINGTISINNLDLTYCTLLTHESLMSVINALVDKTTDTSGTVWKIKLGSTNLAKLTDDEKLIIENKGWTYA